MRWEAKWSLRRWDNKSETMKNESMSQKKLEEEEKKIKKASH